jgi:HNH endonuclease
MDTTHREIVNYWSANASECGLSVDWADAEKRCWRCAQGRQLQRCHIIPRALEGTESPSNLVLLCAQCHAEAPNVADPEFMWVWLRAHAASFYETYWHERGFREYEFIFGESPFKDLLTEEALPLFRNALENYMRKASTHWGQGKLNPATIAWVMRKARDAARSSKIT